MSPSVWVEERQYCAVLERQEANVWDCSFFDSELIIFLRVVCSLEHRKVTQVGFDIFKISFWSLVLEWFWEFLKLET